MTLLAACVTTLAVLTIYLYEVYMQRFETDMPSGLREPVDVKDTDWQQLLDEVDEWAGVLKTYEVRKTATGKQFGAVVVINGRKHSRMVPKECTTEHGVDTAAMVRYLTKSNRAVAA
jgi:hypothetical protein